MVVAPNAKTLCVVTHREGIDFLTCHEQGASWRARGSVDDVVTLHTTMYASPLLQLNANFQEELAALFLPALVPPPANPAAGEGAPFPHDPPEIDLFGPLYRFLLRPAPAISAEVQRLLLAGGVFR